MSWAFLEDVRDWLHRKPQPVIHMDFEVRAKSLDPDSDLEVLCMAYKIDDGPVHVLPWEAALARGDWVAVDRLHTEFFDYIKRQHRLEHYEDLAWTDKSWLTKKFLTFAAWARTLSNGNNAARIFNMGYYWTAENEEREGEVIDINGSSALVRDLETGEENWIDVSDVDQETLDDWTRDNGQFGVGA